MDFNVSSLLGAHAGQIKTHTKNCKLLRRKRRLIIRLNLRPLPQKPGFKTAQMDTFLPDYSSDRYKIKEKKPVLGAISPTNDSEKCNEYLLSVIQLGWCS